MITERELCVGSEWQRRGFCGAHRLAPAGTGCGEGTADTGGGGGMGGLCRSERGTAGQRRPRESPGKERPSHPPEGGNKITKSHTHAHLNIVQTRNVFTADRKKRTIKK